MKPAISLLTLLLCSITACAQRPTANNHNHGTPEPDPMVEQDWAKQRLAKSPRHQEWVKIKNGTREVNSFVVYPENKNKATAVVVIHEIFGMSDWVQSLTDQLAEAGYVAIAPDLLSGMGPNGGGTSSMDRSAIGQAIRDLPPDQITADLNAVADYVSKLPASNGKVVVTGYCWGGSQSFRYATNNPNIKAAFVFYGAAPMKPDGEILQEALEQIKAPVYGFYAGNDARINATLTKTSVAMAELKKKFEPVTYEGAGHGFMRAGDAPEPDKSTADYEKALEAWKANKKARDEAWVRWKKLLAAI
jgi:carboxymethylenebutenolidase